MSIDDLCPLILLAMILIPLGHCVLSERRAIESMGLRIAGAIGLIRGGIEFLLLGSSGDPFSAGILAILTGILLLGPIWICLSILSWFHGKWGAIARVWHDRREEARRRKATETAERLRNEQARRDAIEWERGKPARDSERLRQEELANAARACQRRRDDVRAHCELVYDRLADRIGQVYPRTKLLDFLNRYMGDTRPADEVEMRGKELERLLMDLLDQADPNLSSPSVEDLTRWHREEKRKIEALPLERAMIDYQLSLLNSRYVDLIENSLAQSRPGEDTSHRGRDGRS